MSETYSIACKDCKEHLWIAQCPGDKPDRGYVYCGDRLSEFHFQFLWKHKGHNLVFDENCGSYIGDYREILPTWDEDYCVDDEDNSLYPKTTRE